MPFSKDTPIYNIQEERLQCPASRIHLPTIYRRDSLALPRGYTHPQYTGETPRLCPEDTPTNNIQERCLCPALMIHPLTIYMPFPVDTPTNNIQEKLPCPASRKLSPTIYRRDSCALP